MAIKAKAVTRDNVTITHYAVDGSVKDVFKVPNLITNAGFAGLSALLGDLSSPTAFKWVGIGTGTTAANVTDTALETEITTGGGERTLATTISQVTTSVTNDTLRLQETFTFSSGFSVTEYGVFDAISSGTLLARVVRAATVVVSGEAVGVDWKIDFS